MKSAKEKLCRQSWTWDNGDGNPVRVLTADDALRIMRQVAREAKMAGLQAGWQCAEEKCFGSMKAGEAYSLAQQIATERVSEIIDGKKGRKCSRKLKK